MPGYITRKMSPADILAALKKADGYFLCNNERDVSQSDFKNRLMPMTTVRVAPVRDEAGFFSVEVSGGASIHMDLIYKQVNPFERLRIVRQAMPNTLLQTVCRGASLFGYRHYPENIIRLTVREFAKLVDIWRVYDFLNHVPNMVPAGSWDGFGFALGNAGDEVILLDAMAAPVDALVYGAGEAVGVIPHPGVSASGHSLERRPAIYDTDDCSQDFFDRNPPDPGAVSRH